MSLSRRLRASIVDLTFVVWAVALPFALGYRVLNSDGDAARHLAMGEFVLRGGLFQTDAFAYTHTGPFLTTEWLSQVTYALAARAGGLPGVIVFVGLLLGATYAAIVLFMRRAGVDPLLAFAIGIVAAVLGAPHWVARPHLFTFLALAILLHIAVRGERGRIWWFAPFFAVWANFHGGFVLGLAILAVWAAGDLAEAWGSRETAERKAWLTRARYHGAGALIGLAAATLNPQGPALLTRIQRILSDDFLLGATTEFASLDFHSVYGKLFLMVVLLITLALALRSGRPAFPHLLVLLMLLAGAAHSARNAPLFGLFALPLVAIEVNIAFQRIPGRWLARLRATFESEERTAIPGRLAAWSAPALLVLALLHGRIAGRQIVPDQFDGRTFPVAAVQTARAAGLQGNMFNWFTWGGYILYAWPEQRIFIDGMTDFFGAGLMRSYLAVDGLENGWRGEFKRFDISMVIVPPRHRLVHALRGTGEWRSWYEDQIATILVRDAVATPVTASDRP